MDKRTPSFLRLHVEDRFHEPASPATVTESSEQLLGALEAISGWSLRLAPTGNQRSAATLVWKTPIESGAGVADRQLEIHRTAAVADAGAQRVDLEPLVAVAGPLAELLSELSHAEHSLWQREAELAAGVPVLARSDEAEHLALRLEAVLRGGGEAVGCQAAALYLLDDATSQLKLRSVWGLPRRRLTDPPRALSQAMADLEALLGHVVVLDQTPPMVTGWQSPEAFPTAVCAPVSTPSIPLGTLWMYSDRRRDFSEHETNLIEMVAGRLAADLEREILLAQGEQSSSARRAIDSAALWQQHQLPQIAPLLDGWELAGSTRPSDHVTPLFHDWALLPDGRLAVAIGDCRSNQLDGAMLAAQIRGALRTHYELDPDPGRVLSRLNRTLWTMSVGDQQASLFYGLLDPQRGKLRYAVAGSVAGVYGGPQRLRTLAEPGPLLGLDDTAEYVRHQASLSPGSLLAVSGNGPSIASDDSNKLKRRLAQHPSARAWELVRMLESSFDEHGANSTIDRSILVLRRLPAP